MSALTLQFRSQKDCEDFFKVPGNYDQYTALPGSTTMLSMFKSLGWTIQQIPLPEAQQSNSNGHHPVSAQEQQAAPDAISAAKAEAIELLKADPSAKMKANSILAGKAKMSFNEANVFIDEYLQTVPTAPVERITQAAVEPQTWADRVQIATSRRIPVTPVMPNSKKAFITDWPTSATFEPAQINLWSGMYSSPIHNYACVAKGTPDGVWMFEADSPDVFGRIKFETGHDLMAEVPTFLVRSREGRGHVYFSSTPAALAMGNLSQSGVKHADFSCRVQNQYCVGPGSIHPHTGEPYTAVNPQADILPAPDWFIEWLLQQKTKKDDSGLDVVRNENGKVPHGSIHGWLLTMAGKYVAMGMSPALVETTLLAAAHEQCEPPLDDAKIIQVANSTDKYPRGQVPTDVELNQKPSVVYLADGQVAEVREVQEVVEPATASNTLHLPESAFTSTRLGDIYAEIFKPNDWPVEMALPSLATAASVVVPRMPRPTDGTILLMDDPMTSLFTAQIAPVHVGKTQVNEWGAKAVGIYRPIRGPHYYQVKFGSAEQMFKNIQKYLNVFVTGSMLMNVDEWAHMLRKANIPDSSFSTIMTSVFYQRDNVITVGGQGGGREISIPNLAMSFTGGIVADDFGVVFGESGLGGLYDRFLFGRAPDGLGKWSHRPFPRPVVPFEELGWNPVPVGIDGSVWEVTKQWDKMHPEWGRIVEICTRVATIFASVDGRQVLTGLDLERLEPLAKFQMDIRSICKPNAGANPDAQYANAAEDWINLHAPNWRPLRDLKHGTRSYEDRLGPNVVERSLAGLARSGRIQLWLNGYDKQGQPLPLPPDYVGTGRRPSGLVRRGRRDD